MALLLKESDLSPLFEDPSSMDGLLDVMTETFRSYQTGEGVNYPTLGLGLQDGKRALRVLSAKVPGYGVGLRCTTFFPGAENANFILLFDPDNASLLSVVANVELNIWRTGAPAGVAARHLAPAGPRRLGLLGSGGQARGQLLALRRALPSLDQVRIFSPTEEHRTRFAREMSAWLGIEVQAVQSARAAVGGAQIVDAATSSRTPVLDADWVSPGALVITITSGQTPPELVLGSRVVVSWKKEVLAAAPPREPFASMIASGSWSEDRIAAELGEVIVGRVPGCGSDGKTVLFEMPAIPVWDIAAAAWAYRWALNTGAGTALSLE